MAKSSTQLYRIQRVLKAISDTYHLHSPANRLTQTFANVCNASCTTRAFLSLPDERYHCNQPQYMI
jgi:hypothetical protein